MRTTLEIDDDLLAAAKQVARQQDCTVGQVISRWVRQSLAGNSSSTIRNGVRLFVPSTDSANPDLRLVNQLRDEA